MFWPRKQDPVSLTNVVELLATAGQAKGDEKSGEKMDMQIVSSVTDTASFSLLKKVLSNLKTNE